MSAGAKPGVVADRAWMRRGACRGVAPELFFPPERGDGRQSAPWSPEPAQAVCGLCPVQQDCRAWALATGQKDGVWGGLSEVEMRRLQRQPRRRAS